MATHSLLDKAEKAVIAYLQSEGVGDSSNILPKKKAADLPNPPFIQVGAGKPTETVKRSGNWTVPITVEVHTNAAPDVGESTDTLEVESTDLASTCFDVLNAGIDQDGSQLADDISAAAAAAGIGLIIQDVDVKGPESGFTDKDKEWIDSLELDLICYHAS
jgi:hypothetical protein